MVDLGPGAGERGGEVVFSGSREELDECRSSVTAKFLSGERKINPRKIKRGENGSCSYLSLLGARENNLKGRGPPRSPGAPGGGHGRVRLGQEHAGARHALSGPRAYSPRRQGLHRPLRADRGFRCARFRRPARPEPHRQKPPEQPDHVSQGLRRDSPPVRRHPSGEKHGLRPRAFFVQHHRGTVRVLHRKRHPEDRDALHGRYLHPLSGLRG